MYRWLPSQRASARLEPRVSTTVPVSSHEDPLSRKMWNAELVVSHMFDHQVPSLNQSLLSGFDPDGAVLAPLNDWSLNPICGAEARSAGAACVVVPAAALSTCGVCWAIRTFDARTGAAWAVAGANARSAAKARLTPAAGATLCIPITIPLPLAPSVARSSHDRADGQEHDFQILADRHVPDIRRVEPITLVERHLVSAADLPQAGDPGRRLEPLRVPQAIRAGVERRWARTDERHP